MQVVDALNWRYAVRKFSDKKISAEKLNDLLNAVRLSASSYGLQPYRLIVVSSRSLRAQLLPFSYGQNKVAQSSHLIVLAAETHTNDKTVDRYIETYARVSQKSASELTNYASHIKSALAAKTPEQRQVWAHQQAYIALGNLLTCAALMEIDSCPMTGIDTTGYDAILGLNEKRLTTTVICPIGYRHPDDTQARQTKVRFDLDELVMEL